jgi:Flp pilus assembly protein TadD
MQGAPVRILHTVIVLFIAVVGVACGRAASPTPIVSPTASGGDHLAQGIAHLEAGRVDEAIAELEKATESGPPSVEAHFNLGIAHTEKGSLEEAAQEFQKVLALDPSDADAHSNLGVVYYDQGQQENRVADRQTLLERAVEQFEKARELIPDDPAIRYNLASSYIQSYRLDEAKVELDAAKKLDPDLPLVWYALGNLHALQGQKPEAIEALEHFLELGSDDTRAISEAQKLLESLRTR